MSASRNHQGAIRARDETKTRMGYRWDDAVSKAIDKAVFLLVQEEEKVFGQRLAELDRLHEHAHRRVRAIRSS